MEATDAVETALGHEGETLAPGATNMANMQANLHQQSQPIRFETDREFLLYSSGYNAGYQQGYGAGASFGRQQYRPPYYYGRGRGRGGYRGRYNYRNNTNRQHQHGQHQEDAGQPQTASVAQQHSTSSGQQFMYVDAVRNAPKPDSEEDNSVPPAASMV